MSRHGYQREHPVHKRDIHHKHHLRQSGAEPENDTPLSFKRRIDTWSYLSPLIACILGPLAILMGIPALTQRWRGVVVDGVVLSTLPDPTLNIALAAVTLAFEVFANCVLMLRFYNFHIQVTTRLSLLFWVAKVILALGNYIQFVIKYPQRNFIYLEGFWIGVFGVLVSLIVIPFLALNVLVTPPATHHDGSPHQRLKLEQDRLQQRTFMMRVVILILSMGFGALFFSKVEGWTFVTGLYYTITTILTVGTGDVVPDKTVSRVLLFPYLVFSICYLAALVSSMVTLIGDRLKAQRLVDEANLALSRTNSMATIDGDRDVEADPEDYAKPIKPPDLSKDGDGSITTGSDDSNSSPRLRQRADTVDSAVQNSDERRTDPAGTLANDNAVQLARPAIRIATPADHRSAEQSQHDLPPAGQHAHPGGRRFREKARARKREDRERRARQQQARRNLVLSLTFFLVFWLGGAAAFAGAEGWSYGVAVFFTYITLTTVGYGDYAPSSQLGRCIFIVWALFGVPIITFLIQVVATGFSDMFKRRAMNAEADVGTLQRQISMAQTLSLGKDVERSGQHPG
ncbi:Potassium channel [Savitreella phatthalungensis]